MHELNPRLFHHAARCHGLEIAKLGDGRATGVLATVCCAHLSESWRKKSNIQLTKDAAITGIDIEIVLNTLSKHDLSQMIAKLGKLFEARGNVEVAADLYSNVASFYCKDDSNSEIK